MTEPNGKGVLALYWAASCGGCEIAVLGIDDKILKVAEAFDIVFWPCAVDGKVRDIEKMPDKSIDLCLFNGAIRTSEQEYMARLLRAKSKALVAFGSCAQEGCIPALANLNSREQVFQTAYHDTPSTDNPFGIRPQTETEVPEGTLYLPLFYDTVKTLGQTVQVDYYLPGCPPEADRIWEALVAILENKLPPPGSVIGATTTVCDDCRAPGPRRRSRNSSAPGRSSPIPTSACWSRGCCAAASPPGPVAGRSARRSDRRASAATVPTSKSRISALA
jgi:F420-non-reducing hydrogenase small subunit